MNKIIDNGNKELLVYYGGVKHIHYPARFSYGIEDFHELFSI